jgi:hypothetical protein
LLTGTATLAFIITATLRLWKEKRCLSIALPASTILFCILTAIQEFTKLSVMILINLTKVVYLFAYIWTIVALFKKKDNKELRDNPAPK